MSTERGAIFAITYGVAWSRDDAHKIRRLDNEAYEYDWDTKEDIQHYPELYNQLDKIDGITDTNYDCMFVFDGATFNLEPEFDTDETWEKINTTIADFLKQELREDYDE